MPPLIVLIPDFFIISCQSSEVKFFISFFSFLFFIINYIKFVLSFTTEEIYETLTPLLNVGLLSSLILSLISLSVSFILFFSFSIVLSMASFLIS